MGEIDFCGWHFFGSRLHCRRLLRRRQFANTFQLCASKQRTKAEERKKAVQKKKTKTKKKNEVCWGGCFGARDDERVGVVVETS